MRWSSPSDRSYGLVDMRITSTAAGGGSPRVPSLAAAAAASRRRRFVSRSANGTLRASPESESESESEIITARRFVFPSVATTSTFATSSFYLSPTSQKSS